MAEPRERPILFSGPMVRAILDDDGKTQTRRVVMPQPIPVGDRRLPASRPDDWTIARDTVITITSEPHRAIKEYLRCPYGAPGDRLWVRETWGLFDTEPSDGPERATVYYRATDGNRRDLRYQRWRPSIHMPRWASRITLEVVRVRVERVQDIGEHDARAEGVAPAWLDVDGERVNHGARPTFVQGFALTWNTINAKRGFGWEANPWVWVIDFKLVSVAATKGRHAAA